MFSAKNPSPDYIKLTKYYKKIHKKGVVYKSNLKKNPEDTYDGTSALKFADIIKKIIEKNNCKTLLDYGSGKGSFYFQKRKFNKINYPPIKDFWNVEPTLFDPGVKDYSKPKNKKFDVVVSIDVLEHIPFQDMYWVVNEILSFSNNIVFFSVACCPANVTLEDGRNAHVSLFHPMWWYGFITAISNQYNLKIFLVCYFIDNNKKLKNVSFGINEDFNNYR